MSQPGWYPDPEGEDSRFRFWDGTQWSEITTTDPATQPPPTTPGSPKSGKNPVILVVIIVAILALVIAGLVGAFLVSKRNSVAPGLSSSTPTISAWDEQRSSPTPSLPAKESPAPSQTPSQTSSASALPETLLICPAGDPFTRRNHPENDGWLYGGKIAMRRVDGWKSKEASLYWAYDLASQTFDYTPIWRNAATVSAIRIQENFETPEQAAVNSASCKIHTTSYRRVTGVERVFSKSIQVDGRPAHWVRTKVKVSAPELIPGIEGDVVDVAVVDTGDAKEFSMFLASSTIGDEKTLGTVEELIKGLRVVS